MRRSPFDTSLLPAHQLRLDVMRGILFAHSPRFRLHFGAKACEMAYGIRMECTCSISYTLWPSPWLRGRRAGPQYVR